LASDPVALHSFPTRRSSDLAAGVRAGLRLILHQVACNVAQGAVKLLNSPLDSRSQICRIVCLGDISRPLHGPRYKPARSRGLERSEEHTSELQSRENLVCRL